MNIITDKKRITEILDRGIVNQILPSKVEFEKALSSGKKLKFYIGFDPTAESLHLGHAQNIILLEEFRTLGHEVVCLFGDFTAQIGDPGGKDSARTPLTPAQVKANLKNWLVQVKPLLNFADKKNPPKVLYNNKWLSKLTLQDLVGLASNFTVQQMLERDMFERRWQKETPIYLHEFLYPLMQGYDSVAMDVDVELCGTDQIFNALAGRTLLKRLKNKDKFVVAVNLLSNPKTGQLMSKSQGTGVFLNLPPAELYGAVMAQPDEMIEPLLVNITRLPLPEIKNILKEGPRTAKARVAKEIVQKIHSTTASEEAEQSFNQAFRDKGAPQDIQELMLGSGKEVADALVAAGLLPSKTQWRRLVQDGAVKDLEGNKITDANFKPKHSVSLKIGKKLFVKIIVAK